MKTKTETLTRSALDRAVAIANGDLYPLGDVRTLNGKVFTIEPGNHETADRWSKYSPSTDWAQGGPILERQEIELHKWGIEGWMAKDTNYQFLNTPAESAVFAKAYGPTPLIAAMRCFVASKLGDEIDVPDELT